MKNWTIQRTVEAEIVQTFHLAEEDFEGLNPESWSQGEWDDFLGQFDPDYEEINRYSTSG